MAKKSGNKKPRIKLSVDESNALNVRKKDLGNAQRHGHHRAKGKRGQSKTSAQMQSLLSEAYTSFAHNDMAVCKQKLEKALTISSTCPQVYQTLGTIFEEQGDLSKAFYFMLIAAYIKKTDFELWKRLYFFTFELNMLEDRVKILTEIQKLKDSKEIVIEKIWLYGELRNNFKMIETQLELIKFSGYDTSIFYTVFAKLKNVAELRKICKKMLIMALKLEIHMDASFMMQLIYLSFRSKCFDILLNFFEKMVTPTFVTLPLDLELIFLVTELMVRGTFNAPTDFLEQSLPSAVVLNLDLIMYLADTLYYKELYSECNAVLVFLKSRENISCLCLRENDDERTMQIFPQSSALDAPRAAGDTILANTKLTVQMRKSFGSTIINKNKGSSLLIDEINYRMAPLLAKLGRKDESLHLYLQLYAEDPLNYQIKQAIGELYRDLGAHDLSRQYSIMKDASNIINDITDIDKRIFRYSLEECITLRHAFLAVEGIDVLRIDKVHIPDFLKACQPLIKDCEENPFLLNADRKFKAFLTQDERLNTQDTPLNNAYRIIENKREMTVKEKKYTSARLMSLHGLDLGEWCGVLANYALGCHLVGRCAEATRILHKSLASYILRDDGECLAKLVFVGIRVAVQSNDLDLLIYCVKRLNTKLSHCFFSLVYYFMNFMSSSLKKVNFMMFQRNLQRLYARRIVESKRRRPVPEIEPATITCASQVHENLFMYLNSCLPNFLYPRTLERIRKITKRRAKTVETEIMLAVIFLCHSVSRRISNRKFFVTEGFSILDTLEKKVEGDDKFVVWYNLGRSYHQFGILGVAEGFYKRVLDAHDTELAKMAIFNLALIYQKNGSVHLHRVMLEKMKEIEHRS